MLLMFMRVMHELSCPVHYVLLHYRICYCVTCIEAATSYLVLLICFVAVFIVMESRCMAISNYMLRIKMLRELGHSV
jgi:hypothetical protein